jgi:putative hydrolase of the HAD superfamily
MPFYKYLKAFTAKRMLRVNRLVRIKAVLFDVHGTLARVENPVSSKEISDLLLSRGYEVSPQQLEAAWAFVAFIDYPKYGYKNWCSYFSRIFWRLSTGVDKGTFDKIVKLLEAKPYQLYRDAAEAVVKAKENGFKTAAVTTIAYFQFKEAVGPIKAYFNSIMTGYEAGCDKSNPKMYRRVLEILRVKPAEAVMVGDSIDIDVLLPKRLGISAILLNRERENVECPAAIAIVNSLKEAVGTVVKMNKE